MKNLKVMIALMLVLMLSVGSAMACSSMYIGSALTADGTTMFGRSEDFSSSYNKMMYVSPSGLHKAGDTYEGCYGFTFVFANDSYGYTAFSDDNGAGVDYVCPDCGSTHPHTPYEAGGTNEKGVSMSATETLRGNSAVTAIDPFNQDTGIEEAEITTYVLSQAATAKEGIELLTKVYAEVGCQDGAGVYIADNNEVWYVENVTGHQFIAVKLSDTMVFVEPNVPMIGLIDLDDTENVIASEDLIKVAQEANLFVGDAENNVINYNASYNAGGVAGTRVKDALHYFNAAYDFSESEPDRDLYSISNVDAEGNIVTMYTNIVLDRVFTVADVLGMWDLNSIGKPGNTETHVFQITKEDSLTDTVEWIAMNDAQYNIFVPYYPMLTTEVAAAYGVSTAKATFVTEAPEALCYPTTKRMRENGEVVNKEGFLVYPENWQDSMYWSVDVLAHTLDNCGATDEDKAAVIAGMNEVQDGVIEAWEEIKAVVATAETAEDAAIMATTSSMILAEAAHATIIEAALGIAADMGLIAAE